MSEEGNESQLNAWFSTYGVLTAERILEGFNIHLTHDELATAVKNPHSIYYQLLRIPLKNIFNGIILQQAHDYEVYAQKLFIDYLLSVQNEKEAGAPGENTRDDLEQERQQLVQISTAFEEQEAHQLKLIAESQQKLIKLSSELQSSLHFAVRKIKQVLQNHQIIKTEKLIERAIRSAMLKHSESKEETLALSSSLWSTLAQTLETTFSHEILVDLIEVLTQFSDYRSKIDQVLAIYLQQTEEMMLSLRNYRKQFYAIILHATEWLKLLPDYHPDVERETENRSSLNFDANIGEY